MEWSDIEKEPVVKKINDAKARLEEIKQLSGIYEPLLGTEKEMPWVRAMMAIYGQAEQALKELV